MDKEIIKSDENNINGLYENLTYKELNGRIESTFRNMAGNFIALGFWLKQVKAGDKFKEDGYKDIWEYAKDKYGISRSACSRWMAINDKFSENGNSPTLAEEYRNYGKSQLQEMLYLEDSQLNAVTPGMTVRDIKGLRVSKADANAGPEEMCDIAQAEPEESGNSVEPYKRGCITGWSRYPDSCSCCGHGGAECCSQCDENCNSRCGWIDDPYVPEDDIIPGQMTVEDFPELLPESGLCATSHIEDNDPTEEVLGMEEKPGKCLYRDGFFCTLSEEAKKTPGDGNDCGVKCCWKCTKQGCKLECHSSSTREDEAGQETEGPVADIEYQEVDNIVMVCEEGAAETQQQEAEKYEELSELSDLELLQKKLEKEERLLAGMQEAFTDSDKRVRTQKMIVCALTVHVQDMEKAQNQPAEPVQPEFPVLKNNEQRKEWLRNYKDWGLWYEDENIGCKYYKYDFENGARLIAEAYLVPKSKWQDEHEVYYLHLVGGPEPPKDKTGCYGKWQRHEKYNKFPSSETELVGFLKYVQKER